MEGANMAKTATVVSVNVLAFMDLLALFGHNKKRDGDQSILVMDQTSTSRLRCG